MDATTKKLCEMLRTGDPELQVAAARVLGEVGPKEAPVLAALGAELTTDFAPAQRYAVRALARSATPQAVEYILPALGGPAQLRDDAVEAIVGFGRSAVPHLKGAILGGELGLRKAAATALARIGGKGARVLLLRALAEGSLDLSKHICFELDHTIHEMRPRGKVAFAAQVHAYLARKRTQKNEAAAASGLILLGFLHVPASRKVLLGFARPPHSGEIRRRALLALRGIASQLTQADLGTLVGCLEEEDLGNVVVPTIELLRALPLPPAAAGKIIELVGSPHKPIRDFAIYKMGQLDTPEAAKILMRHLDAPQPRLRELALSSLQRNPAAAPLLLERLKTEDDVNRLQALARVLERHAAHISRAQARSLTRLLLTYLEDDDRRADPLSYLLRHVAPEELDAALLKRAKGLKSKKRFAEANRMLRTLVRGGAASSEALYQAAVVALKVSAKGLGRSERNADPCLRLFERLVEDPQVDLVKRLRAERALDPEDVFYVGFHFAEQLRERREVGGALLRHLVAKAARSAVARHARNKLRLEGFQIDRANALEPEVGKASRAERPPNKPS